MNATILNFLTTDGAVTVTFEKALTVDQYDELHNLIHGQHYTSSEMCHALETIALSWGTKVVVDDC